MAGDIGEEKEVSNNSRIYVVFFYVYTICSCRE